jgi:predicted Zn-dependent protease
MRLDDELGAVYLRLGQRDQARQTFARLSEVDPTYAYAYSQLCKIFWQEGNLEHATKECKTALSLDPQLDEPHITLAQISRQEGKPGEGHLFLAQAMELQGRPEAALAQYQLAATVLGSAHPKAEEIRKKTEELETLISELGKRR